MLARRRPLTVKWIPNTATWNKSSESERDTERQTEREGERAAAAEAAAAKRAVNCTKHVADERVRTPSLTLSLSRSLSRARVRTCVCGCEGSAVIVAAAAAEATSTPAARPSPVSRSVSFKSCHGQRCQPASVPFWLPSNVVVVRLKHASSTANNSSNIPQQQQYQQRAKSILTSRETNKKDHVKKYKLSKDFLKVTKMRNN